MEDSGSWLFHQHLQSLPPNFNSQGSFPELGWLYAEPFYRIPDSVISPTPRIGPSLSFCGMRHSKMSELPNDSYKPDSLYCLPNSNVAFSNVLNSVSKEKCPPGTFEHGQKGSPIVNASPDQKRFLVFDQSGDKTTLIYSSPIHCGTCLNMKPPTTNLINEVPGTKLHPLGLSRSDEHLEDNSEDVLEDEIHEDAEELNALLCSDSDSDISSDNENVSTGSSPSTMPDDGLQDLAEESSDEAYNVFGSTKRQKLLVGYCDMAAQRFSKTFSKPCSHFVLEDEAESAHVSKLRTQELCSFSRVKRKERIHMTASILRSIFPSINGKDPIGVIDEAIICLRSLKAELSAL